MWRGMWMWGCVVATSGALLALPRASATAETMGAKAADCDTAAAPVKYKVIQKTICCPEITMVSKTITCIECTPEIRECHTTMIKKIPHTTWTTKECCVMCPKQCFRTECYTACKPIVEKKPICYEVQVPHQCVTPCTRCVCKPKPVKEDRTRCVDKGHFEEQPCCPSTCPTACGKPCTKKVWIPNMVTENYSVTVWQPEWVQQAYNKVTTTFTCETRHATVNCIKGYTKECKTRQVAYTVCVPTKVTKQIPHTTYTCECVPCVKRYTVMVPHCVTKEIQVPCCRMVQKTITCQVPCCD